MNSKKKEFLISISIVFTFTLVIILYVNYYLITQFGLNQENFIFLVVPILLLGLAIFLSFTRSILNPLFKSDEILEKNIKETLHELNIPISTIKMNVQLLEKNISDEKTLKRLNRINQASNNLLKLYENMEYDIKKQIDKIDIQEFFLDEIINKSLDKFKDIKKDTKIECKIPHIFLKSDMNGFERIIDNLISNAIKYNDKTNPFIKIGFQSNILFIYNNGENIDTKNLFIIFDKYFQEKSSNDGFGLGLSIVKEFCDKNKIKIDIEQGKDGNQFNLNLKPIIA